MKVYFARVNDALISTDAESLKVIRRMGPGECQQFKRITARDTVAHRRYWALMSMIATHCERIEIDRLGKEPVYMPIFSKDNAHTAMKLCTGLYDTLPVGGTSYAVRVPKSTSFEEIWRRSFRKSRSRKFRPSSSRSAASPAGSVAGSTSARFTI